MKLLKHFLNLSLTFCFTLTIVELSYGHPPSKIILKFDNETKVLMVEAKHGTKNVTKHFIGEIQVFINEKLFVTQFFKKQLDDTCQKASYALIDAAPGDEITVKAECSLHGSLKERLLVKKEQKNKDKE